jgi:hypothetical protein
MAKVPLSVDNFIVFIIFPFQENELDRRPILKKGVSSKAKAPEETTFFFIKEVDHHPIVLNELVKEVVLFFIIITHPIPEHVIPLQSCKDKSNKNKDAPIQESGNKSE